MSNEKIPIVHIFERNPLGKIVALVMFFMLILFFGSNNPLNPFASDPRFLTAVWGPLYNQTNWIVLLSVAFFPFALVMGLLHHDPDAEEYEGQTVSGGVRVHIRKLNLNRQSRAKKVSSEPTSEGVG